MVDERLNSSRVQNYSGYDGLQLTLRKQADSCTIHIQGEKHVYCHRTLSLKHIVKEFGKHPTIVSTDGGGTWYLPQDA
jgi:hypothetical protein